MIRSFRRNKSLCPSNCLWCLYEMTSSFSVSSSARTRGYFFTSSLKSIFFHLQFAILKCAHWVWQALSVLSLIPSVPSSLPQGVFPSYDPALASVYEPQTTNWVDRIWHRQKRNRLLRTWTRERKGWWLLYHTFQLRCRPPLNILSGQKHHVWNVSFVTTCDLEMN